MQGSINSHRYTESTTWNLHPKGLVDLNEISRGKFQIKICLSSSLFLAICEIPSSVPYKKNSEKKNEIIQS